MSYADRIRWSGLAAMFGGVLWSLSWILVSFTEDGTRSVLGLSERGWRTVLLNPAMLLFVAGLVAFRAKQAGRSGKLGKAGFAVCLISVGAMLVGNVVEFWVSELFYGTQQSGWAMMGVGFMLLPVGLLLFGVATFKAKVFSGWRRAVPLGFGLTLVLLILIMMAVILLTGSQTQEGLLGAMLLSIAVGWTALGYALWSETTGLPAAWHLAEAEPHKACACSAGLA